MSRKTLVRGLTAWEDPEWERARLGPGVEATRRLLTQQLEDGLPRVDPRPVLQRALRTVPHYQQLFARLGLGAADLERDEALALLPVTRREDLAGRLEHFLSYPVCDENLERGWQGWTSGSTGQPVTYFRPPATIAWFYPFVDFVLRYVGRPPVEAGPRAGIVLLDALAMRPAYGVDLPLFHDTRFEKLDATRDAAELRIRMIELAPRVVTGDPQSLARLVELDLPPEACPDLVLSSAFALPGSLAEDIALATGAVVSDCYSTQETSLIGLSCRLGRGFHLISGACHVESVPVPGTDQSELVVTPLGNPDFVLIRYAPGDLGSVSSENSRCPCGLAGPRITELRGRTATLFRAVDGESFPPDQLTPLLSRLPVRAFQMEQHDPARYTLRLQADRVPGDELVSPIRSALSRLAGVSVSLGVQIAAGPFLKGGNKPEPFRREAP